MDYEISLTALNSKKSEFDSMNSNVQNIANDYNSGAIKQLASTEISGVVSKLTTTIERLNRGYNNSKSWFDRYVNEMTQLEDNLASFSSSSLKAPTMFTGEFMDIFSKVTIPRLQSSYMESEELLKSLKYGSFTVQTFTASNGVTVEYYLYLPKYDVEVDNLPVMVYLHGGNTYGNGRGSWLTYGLTSKIASKEVTPSGIVICPHIVNFKGDNLPLVIRELTDSVVNTYNADTNRISIGGHSYGAITAYDVINGNPGYFAAAVPISGWDKVTEAFNNVKVWAFHGSRDNRGNGSHTTYPGALNALNEINSIGGTAQMHTFEGAWHSNVQNYTFESAYDSPDGKKETVLEWVFRQTKS